MHKFVPDKRHLREVLLFIFNMKKSAAEAHRMISEAYGANAISEGACRDRFRRFRMGDYDVEDKERCGAPRKIQDEEIEALMLEGRSQTDIADALGVSQAAVSKRMIQLAATKEAKKPKGVTAGRVEKKHAVKSKK